MQLSIEKFNPLKQEIMLLVENVKKTIMSIPKKGGYEFMKDNKKILQRKRIDTVKSLEAERSMTNAYSKMIIGLQKELVKIIDEVEGDLDAKIKVIDEEKEKEKRRMFLPERQAKLKAIGIELDDDFVLSLNNIQFGETYNKYHTEFLEEKERKVNEAQMKINAEEDRVERKKELERAKEAGKREAKKKAKIDAEKAKAREEQAEKERLETERIEKERLEKNKKYSKFLSDNGYTEENKNEFNIIRNGNKFILFKKIAEITIR